MLLRVPLRLLLACAPLVAQTTPEALDVVPPGAAAYLFARTPLLAQAKLQGLLQRMGEKVPDPLQELQTRFGLRRLPVDRRGVALVFPELSPTGQAHPLVFLALKDPKDLLAELKATPREGGLYAFKAQGEGRALTLREGWAILGDPGQAQALRKAAKEAGGLRPALGELASWLESQDLSGLLTGDGFWSLTQEIRKQVGLSRAGASAAGDPMAKAEAFLAEAQREVRFIGARVDVDEHGNLKGVLRVQLHPQGQWTLMGAGLEETADRGLTGLKGADCMMAMGGVLPRVWQRELGLLSLAGMGADADLPEAAQQARKEGLDRITQQIRGIHMAMSMPPAPPQQILEVADADAYLRELEAFYGGAANPVPTGDKAKGNPASLPRLSAQRRRVDDHEALAILMAPSPDMEQTLGQMPPEQAARLRESLTRPLSLLVQLDPHTVVQRQGPMSAQPASGEPAPDLKEAAGLKAATGLLPDRAQFYAYFNASKIQETQEASLALQESHLTEEQRRALPPLPPLSPFPAFGFALRFEGGAWELHLGMPWETQLGLQQAGPERQKAVLARQTALQKALQAERAKGAPAPGMEGAEDSEEPDED
ncbi:MAG TPA: hypothetical protein VJ623_02975 [Holophagaceae bacterium]|nr:hypothetical protein [Holophagaceae bacterium]